MQALRSLLGLLGALALAGLPTPSGAQAVGSEFQINTYTTSSQRTLLTFGGHLIASDTDGNFVIVWNSHGQDGSAYGIFGQRYDSAGESLGSEFRVNSFTSYDQTHPSVAAAADGDFVVVWDSFHQDLSGWGVFGQRYDSAGGKLGSEFRVNSYTTNHQQYPSLASDASGNFVVVWSSYGQDGSTFGIFGQRYDSAGIALGPEFRVNSYTSNHQVGASVASDADGDFVVVWTSFFQDGSVDGIFGQRYDSGGEAQGDEFRVNTNTMGSQSAPSVASDTTGNFVVVWRSSSQDGDRGIGVLGQRYDSGGEAQGAEFHVNTYTTGSQTLPSVASDMSGNFLVAWESFPQDGSSYGVFGQLYDNAGVAQGGEFQINSHTTGNQQFPSLGATGTNQFVVAWESGGQDGSGYGVFGQRFNFGGDAITVVSPNTNVNWRIGSLQKIKWTHNLGHRATFRIELDRDDDGDYEELIAAAAQSDSTRGSFVWTVTGPPSGTARVRVSWTDDLAVSDASDVTFQIRPPG
jgi:hypothetical protein